MSSQTLLCVFVFVAVAARDLPAQVVAVEFEPNNAKNSAVVVPCMTAGDSILGTTTGTSTLAADSTISSADCFRVRTCPLPLGIYEHRLVLTTGGTPGHQVTLLGLDVVDLPPPTITPSDAALQYSSPTSTPPRFDQWYGFGRSEEVFVRISGTASSLAPYQATLSTTPVVPIVIAGVFHEGPITITTEGQGHATDTELFVYDATMQPIPGFRNDDTPLALPGGGSQYQSTLQRTFSPGTYYLLVSSFNLADNQLSAPDDDYRTGDVLDFPDLVLTSSTSSGANVSFAISDLAGTRAVPAVMPPGPYEILWYRFTVGPAWSVAPYCFGDTSSLGCPCGNTGLIGRGCANGSNSFGAQLGTSGVPSLALDTFALQGSGMPGGGPSLYFQGTTQVESFFGDGKQCAGGTTIRLGIEWNTLAGSSAYPSGLDLPVSMGGSCTVGATRVYQTWYRDSALYCTPNGFNLTNGVLAVWGP